jgi:hypothetical protein
MTLSDGDLANRRPVWLALSELFLDTHLSSSDLDRLAKELARSPYSIVELDAILLWEVYLACRGNLFSLAGEWAGFDPEWLESRILQKRSPVGVAWAATVGRLGRFASNDWRRVKRRIRSIRPTGIGVC